MIRNRLARDRERGALTRSLRRACAAGFFCFPIWSVGSSLPATVSSISPDVGDTAAGVAVTITGTNFTGATGATIGGVAITSFLVVNDTTITGVAGAHAKGTVDVVVQKVAGNGTLTNGYEYFNPTSLSGCVWWLRADLGVTLNGSNVSAWADQSGVGDSGRDAAQGTANDQPPLNASDATYNNKATIGTFNRSSPSDACRLVTGSWSASYATYTLALVGHAANTGNRYFTYGSPINYSALVNSTNTPVYYPADAFTSLAGGTGVLSAAKGFVMAEQANGGTSKLYADTTETTVATGAVTSESLGGAALNVGSFAGSSSTYGVERVAELFAYNRISLTSAERTRLRKYLNGRYGKSMTA